MALLVQKYGGTSVASVERIGAVADRVVRARAAGHRVVVVVSAMAGETDRLLALAASVHGPPRGREVDAVLASGEQVSIGLTAMALEARGCPARSYTGAQVPIRTDSSFNRARILDVDGARIRADLDAGRVAVVAGFQGVDGEGNVTTLGRGGSDTTGVALAVALGADECRIYTDVDGVYTADPRIVPAARRLDRLTFEEMLELSSLGAKVLQLRAMEFASKYRVPLRVLSSFEDGPGTMIVPEEEEGMERPLISGIAFNRDEAKLTVHRVPDRPGVAFRLLADVAAAGIEVDMIVQNAAPEHDQTDFTFTVHRNDYERARALIDPVAAELGAARISGDARIVKLSLVGVGMRSHAGIASRMFEALARENVNIQMISTSEIKISVVVAERYLELAVRALHEAFALGDAEPGEE